MKRCLIIGAVLFSLFLSGCGAEMNSLMAGIGIGIESAKIANDNLEKSLIEADKKQTEINKLVAIANTFLDTNDPNDVDNIAILLNTLGGIDPNDTVKLNEVITSAIEAYEEGNTTLGVVKEKAKEPSYWLALVLAATAGYQKKRRMDEAKK